MNAVNIVGAGGKRRANDFYPTPPECTIALLDFLEAESSFYGSKNVWEPACGDGAITSVLRSRGHAVIGTDILHGEDENFLTMPIPTAAEWIITNPPFSRAADFIRRAHETGLPFALLLKATYWHSKRRQALFFQKPPDYVLPLTWRPDFTGQGASLMDCAWNVWLNDRRSGLFTLYLPLEKPKEVHNAEEG